MPEIFFRSSAAWQRAGAVLRLGCVARAWASQPQRLGSGFRFDPGSSGNGATDTSLAGLPSPPRRDFWLRNHVRHDRFRHGRCRSRLRHDGRRRSLGLVLVGRYVRGAVRLGRRVAVRRGLLAASDMPCIAAEHDAGSWLVPRSPPPWPPQTRPLGAASSASCSASRSAPRCPCRCRPVSSSGRGQSQRRPIGLLVLVLARLRHPAYSAACITAPCGVALRVNSSMRFSFGTEVADQTWIGRRRHRRARRSCGLPPASSVEQHVDFALCARP